MDVSMLSTEDNPYDPFDDVDGWAQWDRAHGYNCPSLLARVTVLSDDTSEADQDLAIERAIDEIVDEIGKPFIKVTRSFSNS